MSKKEECVEYRTIVILNEIDDDYDDDYEVDEYYDDRAEAQSRVRLLRAEGIRARVERQEYVWDEEDDMATDQSGWY